MKLILGSLINIYSQHLSLVVAKSRNNFERLCYPNSHSKLDHWHLMVYQYTCVYQQPITKTHSTFCTPHFYSLLGYLSHDQKYLCNLLSVNVTHTIVPALMSLISTPIALHNTSHLVITTTLSFYSFQTLDHCSIGFLGYIAEVIYITIF